MTQVSTWVVTPGHAGMENPAIGLAEALGAPFAVKRVHPRAPWTWLPVGAWPLPFRALGPGSDALAPPWPDLLISCGRRAVPYALAIKRASGGRCFVAHIQNPRVAPARFDAVIAPRHDGLTGETIVTTLGSLSRLTRRSLDAAAKLWTPKFETLPRPLVSVLIGGPSRAYRMGTEDARALGQQLAELARREGASLLVTVSRRTGAENTRALRDGLKGARTEMPEGEGAYAAMLGLADAIVVTCDSVNMISEALIAGRPTMVAALPGGGRRIAQFHRALYEAGRARPFAGRLERWETRPFEETQLVAREIERRMAARFASRAGVAFEVAS